MAPLTISDTCGDLGDAHEGVDFGQEFGQFITETLGQAARRR